MIKLVPIINDDPYYKVVFNYMIGDADGYTSYDLICKEEDIEEVMQYINILNKLKPFEGHWGVGFDDYPTEYPGDYIGLSEKEYDIFIDLLNSGDDPGIRGEICECLRDRTEYSFLVFQGASAYYYDIFNTKFNVELE